MIISSVIQMTLTFKPYLSKKKKNNNFGEKVLYQFKYPDTH